MIKIRCFSDFCDSSICKKEFELCCNVLSLDFYGKQNKIYITDDDYDDFEDDYLDSKPNFRNETQQQIRDAWGETKIPDKSKQRIPEEEFDEI